MVVSILFGNFFLYIFGGKLFLLFPLLGIIPRDKTTELKKNCFFLVYSFFFFGVQAIDYVWLLFRWSGIYCWMIHPLLKYILEMFSRLNMEIMWWFIFLFTRHNHFLWGKSILQYFIQHDHRQWLANFYDKFCLPKLLFIFTLNRKFLAGFIL